MSRSTLLETGDFGVDGVNGDNARIDMTGVKSSNSSSLSSLCRFPVDRGDLSDE